MDTARGATLDDDGTLHLAVPATPGAEGVELCLLGDGSGGAERRVALTRGDDDWWRGSAGSVTVGDHYGVRVHGPWDPRKGVRTNPAKLLVEPWARRVAGGVTDAAAATAHRGDPFTGGPCGRDSATAVPHAVVVADLLAPVRTGRPGVPWADTVIYETHVRDLTMRHPEVPEHLRGTYLGVAHPAVIAHLVELGITTVELLPVFANAAEPSLLARGRHNHWGYSTLAYLAPEPRYAAVAGAEEVEVRAMVEALHDAGLEVLLDVVFNHTCEGGPDGTSLSWRGLDAAGWYSLDPDGRDVDLTGCGNTLDAGSPLVQTLVVDCLRTWVSERGVDGFRFDLASTLGRPGGSGFDPASTLLTALADDPVLATAKLIAEPWDATGEGYQVGGFGPAWAEWNGRFRDDVRDFWRGRGDYAALATRMAGSSDLYRPGRAPHASVNFVTAHDGFTLADLVAYDGKHNAANGEDNRDGTDDNRSSNHGVEGPTEDARVLAARARTARGLLATLGLSLGTPMLLGGDELGGAGTGHTQRGNNNVYCLDDETSWRGWPDADRALSGFVARVLALRRDVPELRRDAFFTGRPDPGTDSGTGSPDVAWLDRSASELGPADFHTPATTLVVRVHSAHALLLVLHAGPDPVDVVLPAAFGDAAWRPVLDAGTPEGAPADPAEHLAGSAITVAGRSFLAFRAVG